MHGEKVKHPHGIEEKISNMSKIPLTILPIIAILITVLLFVFNVRSGSDLISATGDYILGVVIGITTLVSIIIDFKRFKTRN